MTGESAAIAVSGLTHRFGDTEVLHDVGFEVPWGAICGYLGPNGAGKTTTIRAITGLLRPTGGEVRIDGRDPYAEPMAVRRILGLVPDDGGLYRLLSGREHLTLVADLHELEPQRAKARTEELVELLEIAPFFDRRIDTLSRGQRQRIALACGLLHEPRLLILDEPLSGLDVHAVRVLRTLLRELVDRGGAVLYSSHILDVVERLCDRTVILSAGAVVADAPTAELVAGEDETLEGVFHQLTRMEQVEGLAEAFADGARTGGKRRKKKR